MERPAMPVGPVEHRGDGESVRQGSNSVRSSVPQSVQYLVGPIEKSVAAKSQPRRKCKVSAPETLPSRRSDCTYRAHAFDRRGCCRVGAGALPARDFKQRVLVHERAPFADTYLGTCHPATVCEVLASAIAEEPVMVREVCVVRSRALAVGGDRCRPCRRRGRLSRFRRRTVRGCGACMRSHPNC